MPNCNGHWYLIGKCFARLACASIVALLLGCSTAASNAQLESPYETSRDHAPGVVQLGSIQPEAGNFAHLEELSQYLMDARVVLLGEPSHGDGAAFLAKTKLIRFLHERLGFNVLAFESSLYNCAVAQIRAKQNKYPANEFDACVSAIWARSAELKPLSSYWAESQTMAEPLLLAGIDPQFTGNRGATDIIQHIERAAAQHSIELSSIQYWPLAKELLKDLATHSYFRNETPKRATISRAQDALSDLHSHLQPFVTDGRSNLALLVQTLESTIAYATYATESSIEGIANVPASIANIRDIQMGRNLIWLARKRFPNEKIIVWGASRHWARNLGTLDVPDRLEKQYHSSVTTGDVAKRELGDRLYSVGVIAYSGEYAPYWSDDTYPLEAEEAGTIEQFLAGFDTEVVFVDFDAARIGGLERVFKGGARPLGYVLMSGDWSTVFDGFLFIERMTRSTRRQ